MSTKATVTSNGAILLGKHVACDAYDETKPLRIVSHAHADHTVGLRKSLKTCEKVLMTKATKDLIDAMMGPRLLANGYVETLEYGKTIQHEEETITLFSADHILGAAQVLVEDVEGTRIAYTGDFRLDETPILEADILVMEATYGSPACRRHFHKDIKEMLIALVEKGLKTGPVHIFGYHGKIQEVMQILHKANVNAPFITPERIFHISKVCEQHGMRLGKLIPSEEKEAQEILQKSSPSIAFSHMSTRNKTGQDAFRIYVSGWEFNSPIRQTAEKEYIIALSDHSDYNGLIEYARRSKPKLIITDNYRVGHAETLAKEIHKHFEIPTTALPKRQTCA